MQKEIRFLLRFGTVALLALALIAPAFASGDAEGTDSDDVELTWMLPDRPIQPLRPDSTTIDEVYRLTGVRLNLEGVPDSDFNQVATTLFATDDLPDIIEIRFAWFKDFYDTGSTIALSDHFDQMPYLAEWVDNDPQIAKFFLDGKLYHFPKFARYINRMGQVPMIRHDILEELDLDVPDSFDELTDVLRAMKAAYPESFPYSARGLNLLEFSYSFGSAYAWGPIEFDHGEGRWIYGPQYPEFRDALAWLNTLYREGLLDPDYATNTTAQWQEKLGSSQSFFYFDNGSFAINMNLALAESTGVPDAFGPIPTMENPYGERRNRFYSPHWYSAGSVVSSDVDNRDKVLEFVDWLYSDEGTDTTNFGRLGEDYTIENGEYVISPEIVEARLQDSDPWRSYMSYMVAGLFGISGAVDERNQFPFMSDSARGMYEFWGSDPYMVERFEAPPFTPEENERLKTLRTQIDTVFEEHIHRFIMGDIPISRFDDFVRQLKAAGVDELEEMYNEAEARIQG